MPVVPALPDTERISSHTISGAGPYNVGFDIYGNSTDYANWVEVYDDGVELTAVTDWTLDSPSGALATIARPITDARVTLTSTGRSGTLKIVGADRPRRASQLTEGVGVSARDVNQFQTQNVARQRETWDVLRTRTLIGRPGEAVDMMLPAIATRASKVFSWDSDGKPTVVEVSGQFTFTDPNSVDNSMLIDMDACSVQGRAANTSGDPAPIAASANGQMLRRLSDAVGWGTLTAFLDSVLGSTRGMILRREASNWAAYAVGASGTVLTSNGTDAAWAAPSAGLPQGYGFGCTFSNNSGDATNDADFAAGRWRDSTNTVDLVGTAMTKRLDADWAAGTGNGGRYSGAAITNTTYSWFLIGKADGTTDYFAYAGVDPTAVLPTDYLYFRRICSIPRISGAILGVSQKGNRFLMKVPANSVSLASMAVTTAVTFTVVGVPTGIQVEALLGGRVNYATSGANQFLWVSSLDQTAATPDAINATIRSSTDNDSFFVPVRTNTSGQARWQSTAGGAADALQINCWGWDDTRERDG